MHIVALSPARGAPEVHLDLFLLHPIHSDLAWQGHGIGSGSVGLSNGGVLIKNSISRSIRKGQIGLRRFQIGPDWPQKAQIGSDWSRLGL